MNVNTKTMVSISEANQNFSKVARLVDENAKKQLTSLSNFRIQSS